jgi:hypothetical protein
MRRILLALLAAVALPAAKCREQGTPPTKARVIAEAVTTYRHPGSFFLVNRSAHPYRVIAAFATRDSAARFAADSGGRLEVSGPHTGPSSTPAWEVLAISVRVRTADRETTLQYDPRSADAVFLTMQAVDKFMIPYYRERYGRTFADSIRQAVIGRRPPVPPCHAFSMPCEEIVPPPQR